VAQNERPLGEGDGPEFGTRDNPEMLLKKAFETARLGDAQRREEYCERHRNETHNVGSHVFLIGNTNACNLMVRRCFPGGPHSLKGSLRLAKIAGSSPVVLCFALYSSVGARRVETWPLLAKRAARDTSWEHHPQSNEARNLRIYAIMKGSFQLFLQQSCGKFLVKETTF